VLRVRRAEKLGGQPDIVVVKDVPAGTSGVAALGDYAYHAVATDPDMVLDFAPGWRRYEDYAAALNAKYRQTARQVRDAVARAGSASSPRDVAAEGDRLTRSTQVRDHATPWPVRLSAISRPGCRAGRGSAARWSGGMTARRLRDQLRDGDTVAPHDRPRPRRRRGGRFTWLL
jgi:hypothetical protein